MSQRTSTEHRRLAVLRHLEAAPAYRANASIIFDVVVAVGVPTTRDQLNAALQWLDEQELIQLDGEGDLVLATVTARGVEVALGQVVHPGVKRPSPR